MFVKIVLVLFLIAIVVALFAGLTFLVKDPSDSTHRRTLKALTWRVALQVALIVFLVIAFFMGWLRPHDINGR